MPDYREIVKGRVVAGQDRHPLAGAQVNVFDKDLLLDDHLGSATTDGDGCFSVEFRWSDYKETFEVRPDIFVKVTDPGSGKITRTKVYEELTGDLAEDDSVEVMDLGEISVD